MFTIFVGEFGTFEHKEFIVVGRISAPPTEPFGELLKGLGIEWSSDASPIELARLARKRLRNIEAQIPYSETLFVAMLVGVDALALTRSELEAQLNTRKNSLPDRMTDFPNQGDEVLFIEPSITVTVLPFGYPGDGEMKAVVCDSSGMTWNIPRWVFAFGQVQQQE